MAKSPTTSVIEVGGKEFRLPVEVIAHINDLQREAYSKYIDNGCLEERVARLIKTLECQSRALDVLAAVLEERSG